MSFSSLALIFKEPPASSCKGIVARYRNHAFATRAGVRRVESVTVLKRKSCPGCDGCGPVLDFLNEFPDALEVDSKVIDGDQVWLSMVPDDPSGHTRDDCDWHVLARRCM